VSKGVARAESDQVNTGFCRAATCFLYGIAALVSGLIVWLVPNGLLQAFIHNSLPAIPGVTFSLFGFAITAISILVSLKGFALFRNATAGKFQTMEIADWCIYPRSLRLCCFWIDDYDNQCRSNTKTERRAFLRRGIALLFSFRRDNIRDYLRRIFAQADCQLSDCESGSTWNYRHIVTAKFSRSYKLITAQNCVDKCSSKNCYPKFDWPRPQWAL